MRILCVAFCHLTPRSEFKALMKQWRNRRDLRRIRRNAKLIARLNMKIDILTAQENLYYTAIRFPRYLSEEWIDEFELDLDVDQGCGGSSRRLTSEGTSTPESSSVCDPSLDQTNNDARSNTTLSEYDLNIRCVFHAKANLYHIVQ